VGYAFGFCKRVGDTFTTVSPISTCKDYLSDQVYSEATGNPYSIYGFSSKKQNIFDDGSMYLAMSYLGSKHDPKYKKDNAYIIEMMANHKKVESIMVRVEDVLAKHNVINKRTSIVPIDDTHLLISADAWWAAFPYRISLYSFLVRIAAYSKIPDNVPDPIAFFKDNNADKSYIMKYGYPALVVLTKETAPLQPGVTSPHSKGIYGFLLPGGNYKLD
jgi:hypothetical protein